MSLWRQRSGWSSVPLSAGFCGDTGHRRRVAAAPAAARAEVAPQRRARPCRRMGSTPGSWGGAAPMEGGAHATARRALTALMHTDKHERVAVEGDQVHLAGAGSRVALQDAKAERLQVLGGALLAGAPERTAGIVAGGRGVEVVASGRG